MSHLPMVQPPTPLSHSSPESRCPLLHAVAQPPEALHTRPEEHDAHGVICSPQVFDEQTAAWQVAALHADRSDVVHSTQLFAEHTGVVGLIL